MLMWFHAWSHARPGNNVDSRWAKSPILIFNVNPLSPYSMLRCLALGSCQNVNIEISTLNWGIRGWDRGWVVIEVNINLID